MIMRSLNQIVIGIHVLHEEVKHAEALLEACEAGGLAHRRVSEVHADARPSWHGWEEAERIIHIISIAILSLFALELLLLMIGLGATFFRSPFYMLDAAIIATSLFFDLSTWNNEGAGLFILLRIWRLVRILHGVLEASTLTPDHSPGVLKTREPGARQLREKMKGAREAIARAQTLPHEATQAPFLKVDRRRFVRIQLNLSPISGVTRDQTHEITTHCLQSTFKKGNGVASCGLQVRVSAFRVGWEQVAGFRICVPELMSRFWAWASFKKLSYREKINFEAFSGTNLTT